MSDSLEVGRYYEDFVLGVTFRTHARTIGAGLVDAFAGATGDFAPVHTDAIAASNTIYGERIAHGLLSLSVLQGLMWQTRYTLETGIASLGWDSVKFVAPVRIGDTVRAEFSIREARISTSRPDAGILVEDCRLINQDGKVVLKGDHVLLVKRRQAGERSGGAPVHAA
jgi:acyl dehydratase